MGDRCYIGSLDGDQIVSILKELPASSVVAFGMSCRRFKEVSDIDVLWRCLCRRDWGLDEGNLQRKVVSWKSIYRHLLYVDCAFCHPLSQRGGQLPSPRASHSLNVVSGVLVLFGGGCEGGRHLDDTWSAPITGSLVDGIRWQKVTNGIPSGRFGQTCTVVGELLALFGGINDQGIRQNDTWIGRVLFDGSQRERISWKLLNVPSAPAPRGAHASCFAGDDRMIIYGGIGPDGLRLNDTWLLDFSGKQEPCWHEVETLWSPPARSGHSLTWIGGSRMILFGGRGSRYEVLNDVWMFDMEGNYPEWIQLCAHEPHPIDGIPTPRSGHSATSIFGGRILIYGGEDTERGRKDDIWLLDPNRGDATETPSSCTSSPDVRVPEYTLWRPAHKMWRKLKLRGAPLKERSFHGACAIDYGCSVLIFGGMIDGEIQPAAALGLSFDAELYLLELVP